MTTCKYHSLFHYAPSIALAAFYASAFSISAVLHLGETVYFKTWSMMPLVVGAWFEAIGYIMRCLSASEEFGCWSLPPFIVHSVLVLVAPAAIAASLYMLLEKIIRVSEGESYSIMSARWITRIFVAGDIVSFLVQSYGGSMITKPDASKSSRETGQRIVLVGLIVQIAFGVLFVIVSSVFHYRLHKNFKSGTFTQVNRWLITLYSLVTLITIRNIFRVIEHSEGKDSDLVKREYFVYLFDASPMLFGLLWLNWFHPYKMNKSALCEYGYHGYPLSSGFHN
ncbi:rta1 domain protein [Colletotrichum truncatum]|uniref:Rta1 domain protein n=1 Tax=Colletotrichum truncatum TaxID=5467 RepID=A0ACC3YYY9_COLTU|nr:rta1 domain protein [Colletotrichum truncatum]KAF6782007.1 rta1 domain protein [Colletotrichum truncatum]